MGNIRYLILFMSLIIVHELGHFLTAKFLKWKGGKIYIYPYGGITKLNEKINVPIKEELLVLVMGPLTQVLFFYLVIMILPDRYLDIFKSYHLFILGFNLLPIYPLDGGRLLGLLLQEAIAFRKSLRICIKVSYFIIIGLCGYFIYDFSVFFLLVLSLTLLKVLDVSKEEPYLFEKFLLERRLYKFSFKKRKVIKRKEDMKRDTEHFIKIGEEYVKEKEFL